MRIIFLLPVFISLLTGSGAFSQSRREGCLPKPKNIILMIGDGVGYNHMLAANQYQGVRAVAYEHFPVRLAMAHCPAKAGGYEEGTSVTNYYASGYNPALAWKDTSYLKSDVTESAAAATALATGFKTYNNAIGVSVEYDTLENLTERAKAIGKSAGVVTTVEFSHATPAGFVAHTVNRANYPEIARQMLLLSRCDVIMGCGDPMYDNDAQRVATPWKNSKYVIDSAFWRSFTLGSGRQSTFTVGGKPQTVADADGDGQPDPWTVVRTAENFRALQHGPTPKRVLGCPLVYETLQQARTMKNDETNDTPPFTTPLNAGVPTLAGMVSGALNVLDNNPEGFFLMIEGGAVDWASHGNQKGRLVEEMLDFQAATDSVISWVEKNSSWDETLLIVTGDHETGLLWGEKPFAAIKDKGKGELPVMTFYSKEHSNSLIPFYARGCGSELYRGFADEHDSVRGPFIQNAEVAQLIRLLWHR